MVYFELLAEALLDAFLDDAQGMVFDREQFAVGKREDVVGHVEDSGLLEPQDFVPDGGKGPPDDSVHTGL